jgi:Flp pilus assembly protein TadD/TolB-like protein
VTSARGACLWLCVLVALSSVRAEAQETAAGTGASRLLVVPFENASASARLYWLGEASAVLPTDDLSSLGARPLSREDRLLAFDRLHLPPASVLSHATAIRIGELVRVQQVVVGSYAIAGETLAVRARIIQLDSGRILPEVAEAGPLGEMFQIFDRVARRLVPGASVGDDALEQGRPPIAAFEQYIKGLLAQSPAAQVQFLSEALSLAPGFQRVRIGLWEVRTAQGEHQQALDIVRQVPVDHPLSRRARFLAALSLIELAQWAPAADTLADLHRQRPDASLVNNLGVVQLRRPVGSSLIPASSYFEEAIRNDRSDADLFFNLGYARWQERDLAGAIDALREVVRRNPADADAHLVLAVALQVSGSAAEAARERDLARQLSVAHEEWVARTGGTTTVPPGLVRMKSTLDVPPSLRIDDAIDAAGQRNQQEQALFHMDTGRRLIQAERDTEAIAALRRAVYLAPYQSEAHLLLGRAYLRSGQVADAVSALKISIGSADTIAARLLLGEAHLQGRDAASARAEAQAVLRRDPENLDARRLLERANAN